MSTTKNRAVFFDRDDTLMLNVPYLGDPALVEIFPETSEALEVLKRAGFLLFVVSNQSGVGRGLISREQVHAVNAELTRQMGTEHIHTYFHSFATPDDPYATDRKPSPEIVLAAAVANDLDLAQSFFIGDRLSDIECGLNAGCRTIYIAHEKSSRRNENDPEDVIAKEKAHYTTTSLLDAARWILDVSTPLSNSGDRGVSR